MKLSEVMQRAEAAGLSYGQWVAQNQALPIIYPPPPEEEPKEDNQEEVAEIEETPPHRKYGMFERNTDKIKEDYDNGEKSKIIAQRYGLSISTLNKKVKELGWERDKPLYWECPWSEDEFRRLYAELSLSQLAARGGCHPTTIRKRALQLGIKGKRGRRKK